MGGGVQNSTHAMWWRGGGCERKNLLTLYGARQWVARCKTLLTLYGAGYVWTGRTKDSVGGKLSLNSLNSLNSLPTLYGVRRWVWVQNSTHAIWGEVRMDGSHERLCRWKTFPKLPKFPKFLKFPTKKENLESLRNLGREHTRHKKRQPQGLECSCGCALLVFLRFFTAYSVKVYG